MNHFIASLVSSAPVVKNITAIDSKSVHVEWFMPNETNGIVSIYTISYATEDGLEKSLIVHFDGQIVSQSLRYCIFVCNVQCHVIIMQDNTYII